MFKYKPTPSGERLMRSRAYVKGIMGPIGGGKSTAALMDQVQAAVLQEPYKGVRRSRIGILRNTLAQLRDTVKPLINEWLVDPLDGRLGYWKHTEHTFCLRFKLPDGTTVESDFMLLAADTPDDVRRLLSLQLTRGWVEEAREINEEVFSGFTGRVNRFPARKFGGATCPGITFSTNPPAVGTFWHKVITAPPEGWDVFRQPPALLEDGAINPQAENLENLASDYYENLIDGKDADWIDVYLKNKFGIGNAGQPVFGKLFRRGFHVSEAKLEPVLQSDAPIVIGMDNGLQAATGVVQRDAWGRVNVLGECYVPKDNKMGVESFLDTLLLPYLSQRFPHVAKERYVVAMDPACFQRAQVNEKTIDMAVRERGFKTAKAPGNNDPERRVQVMEDLLKLQLDGGPGFRLDPRCRYLAEGLEWGYRYKKTGDGQGFMKDHHSHSVEALVYACLFLSGVGAEVSTGRPKARVVVPHKYVYATS